MSVITLGLNRATLGRTYVGQATVADAGTIKDYALATSDENPRYLDAHRPGGIVAPPMYLVRVLKGVLFEAMLDPEVNADMLMLVHGEQDIHFRQLVRPGDVLEPRCEIAEILDKENGQVLKLTMRCDREGVVVADALATMFIRPRQKKEEKKTAAGKPREAAPLPAWTFEDPIVVRPDQSIHYARASLDDNPIHVDDAVGKAAGLGGMILQGLCSMAFCQRAVVNAVLGGDPAALRRLKVRFSRPVHPGDTITVQGAVVAETPKHVVFRAINHSGQPVITDGVAEVD